MIALARALLAAAALSLLAPAPAFAKRTVKPSAKITVHPKRHGHSHGHWRGYGFLPGYRPSLAETQGLPILGEDPRPKDQPRFFDLYGNVYYGWGPPRFYRGQWNGGSFGPCYTYTPIGMMWNCGP
jgi:hypothetical protein